MNIEYREIKENELNIDLFKYFIRHQVVNKCWRKENNEWVIKEDPFIDDWSKEDYIFLTQCLKNTINTGGLVYGAFYHKQLKGFMSIEKEIFDENEKYCDLTSIHISKDMRHNGIGKTLFLKAKSWAKDNGANKLYISAHSSIETQAFYKAMGCVEAKVYNTKHTEAEPYDLQLECLL